MKIAAVIAEYNPFHTGHFYQLRQIRQEHNIDYIIVIMSGDFVQRGAPAIIDKYTRSQMALSCGADLVLELPVPYALGSAEYFAYGAVSLLDSLHVVDLLHFGSECGNIDILLSLAELYTTSPIAYQEYLSAFLKAGVSYPVARTKATIAYFKQEQHSILTEEDLTTILSSPNNVLGIEYCKAILKLKSSIKPVTIGRIGASYHEKALPEAQEYPSATAIRNLLSSGQDCDMLDRYIPSAALEVYQHNAPILINENDFSSMLHYKLLMQSNRTYTEYLDITPDLSDRIAKSLQKFTTFQNFCMLLKSKNYTYTRICRCMFHILLNIRQEDAILYSEKNMPHYIRMLGFRKEASAILSQIKQNSDITLLSKLADYDKLLTPDDQRKMQLDLTAYSIYQSAITAKTGNATISEFSRPSFPF